VGAARGEQLACLALLCLAILRCPDLLLCGHAPCRAPPRQELELPGPSWSSEKEHGWDNWVEAFYPRYRLPQLLPCMPHLRSLTLTGGRRGDRVGTVFDVDVLALARSPALQRLERLRWVLGRAGGRTALPCDASLPAQAALGPCWDAEHEEAERPAPHRPS
jgi:hypothetical protein